MVTQTDITEEHQEKHIHGPIIGGVLGLIVAMGIGRFAYTPLLPVMEDHFHFSVTFASLLASWNYLGYLIGAIAVGWLPSQFYANFKTRYHFILIALFGSCITTAGMAFSESHLIWSILRTLGGAFSAGVLVVSSSLIMDWLTMKGHTQKVGILYAGVGIGISITGMLVPLFGHFGGWKLGWLGLGMISLIFAAGTWGGMRDLPVIKPFGNPSVKTNPSRSTAPFYLWGIIVAYGLEGLGYIVMATFITAFFRQFSSEPWLGNLSWVIVGLAAAPSTWLWAKVAHGWKWDGSIYVAFICQGVGVLLPVIWPGVTTAIIGSILFGGTFMGITTLALSIGRQCSPENSGRVIGNMTAVFGLGQVAGPILAGAISSFTHSYDLSMLLSSLLLFSAVMFLWLARKIENES